MNANHSNPLESNDQSQDSARLQAGLRAIYGHRLAVPGEVDQTMRLAISAHFDRAVIDQRNRWSRWRIVPWTAAAAGIMAAVWMMTPAYSPGPMLAGRDASDVDRNGRVDVLDAFMLARRLESGTPIDTSVDVNQDGRIDSRDVDAIAQRAVALHPTEATGVSG